MTTESDVEFYNMLKNRIRHSSWRGNKEGGKEGGNKTWK